MKPHTDPQSIRSQSAVYPQDLNVTEESSKQEHGNPLIRDGIFDKKWKKPEWNRSWNRSWNRDETAAVIGGY